MLDKVQRLKIIFVTDIHLHKEGLDKLQKWAIQYTNNESQFDYCFIGGDTANCQHHIKTHNEEQMFEATLSVHQRLKNIFPCPQFFVPGNHDPKVFFQEQWKDHGFKNIHNKVFQLSQGLNLMGFGGSTPGISKGEDIWPGFPYSNDQQLQKQCKKGEFFQEQAPQNKYKTIILSHEGPKDSETTVDRKFYSQRVVETGSKYLNTFLKRKDVILWLHGHTHDGSKYSMANKIPIINPGALKQNQFMFFELSKVHGNWMLSKTSFEKL